MAEKVWIVNRYWNKVSHRALTPYERRDPMNTFHLCRSIHATEQEAMAALVGYRREALAKAKKELASAERALAKAQQMQKEASHG